MRGKNNCGFAFVEAGSVAIVRIYKVGIAVYIGTHCRLCRRTGCCHFGPYIHGIGRSVEYLCIRVGTIAKVIVGTAGCTHSSRIDTTGGHISVGNYSQYGSGIYFYTIIACVSCFLTMVVGGGKTGISSGSTVKCIPTCRNSIAPRLKVAIG